MGKAKKLKQLRKIEHQKQLLIKQKHKKKKIIIFAIILIAVAMLIIGTIGVVNYQKNKNIKQAVIETEKGNIKINLYPKAAPKTVENFIKLANKGFYNGTKFHRVVPGFIIQGGDPLSKDNDPSNDGTGGPGYVFNDEINPKSLGLPASEIKNLEKQGYKFRYDIKSIHHDVGVISMANSGPNTNGSQFFIVTDKPQPELDGRYTAFGKVYQGMSVVRKIKKGDIIKRIYIIK